MLQRSLQTRAGEGGRRKGRAARMRSGPNAGSRVGEAEQPLGGTRTLTERERLYGLFGFGVLSDYRFRTPMADSAPGSPVSLRFRRVVRECTFRPSSADCIHRSALTNRFNESAFQVYRDNAATLIRFPRIADFSVYEDEILCVLPDSRLEHMVEICLLGHVFAYYLESRGILALHGGAVAVRDQAVLFLADRGIGKTSIVTAMVAAGHRLLADDLAAIELASGGPDILDEAEGDFSKPVSTLADRADREYIVCRPAFPQLKLNPDQLRRYLPLSQGSNGSELPLVHPGFDKRSVPVETLGRFACEALPVARIYILERHDRGDHHEGAQHNRTRRTPTVNLDPVCGGTALLQLLRHSFLSELFEEGSSCSERRAQRLAQLGRVVTAVPVRRLCYPSGYEHLPALLSAIETDLHTAGGDRRPKRGFEADAPAGDETRNVVSDQYPEVTCGHRGI